MFHIGKMVYSIMVSGMVVISKKEISIMGIGMVVFLTNSPSVYDTAEHADFPGEQNCGNPDCPGCNPKPTVVASPSSRSKTFRNYVNRACTSPS